MPLDVDDIVAMASEPLLSTRADALARYELLLSGPETPPPVRLPQDFRHGLLTYGILIDGEPYVVRGDRELQPAEDFGAENYGLNNVRFSKEGIKRFLRGDLVDGPTLATRIESFIRRFVVMADDVPTLMTLWIVGTYAYTVFEYFPYLVLRSPEKRCGKSRTLDLIALLAFNAHQPTASPTEAQIFREPREDGGVQIYDELEGMTGDKERWSAVNAVFNVGFHRGAVVSRYRKSKGGQEKETFETYVPRAIASISALETTLEDRSLMVMMQRLLPGQSTERFSMRRLNSEAQSLRDDLYLFALSAAPALAELYDDPEAIRLPNLDHRAVDLWEPIMAIAMLLDASGQCETWTTSMLRLSKQLGADRSARSADDVNPCIIEVLDESLLAGTDTRIATDDLAEKIRTKLGWQTLTPKALAARLHPLGLKAERWRDGKNFKRGYRVTRQHVDDLMRRYTPGNLAHAAT